MTQQQYIINRKLNILDLGEKLGNIRVANRVSEIYEKAVLDYSLEWPTHGQTRAANELKRKGTNISSGGIRSIWLRHKLEKKHLRLKRLEEHSAKAGVILTESQVQALEDAKQEKQAHGVLLKALERFISKQ